MRINLVTIVFAMFASPVFAVDETNLPGNDYANFNAPSAWVCRNTCGGEPRCQAYTWVKPGSNLESRGRQDAAGSNTPCPTS